MPSLADTLRNQRDQQNQLTRDSTGQLTDQTPQSVSQLAGQAGLAAPPTTAIGAGMLGANQNQQAMMGTPAQKENALQQAVQPPEQTLQGTIRRQQARTQMTSGEQGEAQKSQDMQNLGSLGQRVTDFMQAQTAKFETAAQAAPTSGGVAVAAAQAYNGQQLAPYAADIAALRANPADMQAQLQVNKDLGLGVGQTLTSDQINQLYESSNQSVATGAGNTVQNSVSVNDLLQNPQFGYDANSLSNLLGVPAAQISGMSIDQLRGAIANEQQKEFSKSATLGQQATSNELGQAVQGAAQQAGREASATGLRASEDDVNRMVKSIQNADQVQFGGQSYKIDDLLKSDTISGIVTDYLNAAPGSSTRTQLESTEPGLIDFINKNQAVLQDAAQKLGQGATQFGNIQTQNQQTATLGGKLDPSVAEKLVPNYDQLQAQAIDPNSVPTLQYAQKLTPDQQQQYGSTISGMANKWGDSFTSQLSSLTPDQLAQTQFENPNSPVLQNYTTQMQTYQTVQQSQDLGSLLKNGNLFNQPVTPDQLEHDIQTNNALETLALAPNGMMDLGAFQAGDTGQLDSIANIKQKLAGSEPTLAGAIGGTNQIAGTIDYKPTPLPDSPVGAALYKDLGTAAASGNITSADIADAFESGSFNTQDGGTLQTKLGELQKLSQNQTLDPATQKQVQQAQGQIRDDYTNLQVNQISAGVGTTASVGSLSDAVNKYKQLLADPNAANLYDTDTLQQKLSQANQQLGNAQAAAVAQTQKEASARAAQAASTAGQYRGRFG